MRRGILQIERLLALSYQANQTFTQWEDDLPYCLAVQADGFHQYQLFEFGFVEIEGTDVGAHRLADAAHHGG